MNLSGKSLQQGSKFNAIHAKLLQGQTPKQISPQEDSDQFYANLLALDVNRDYLEVELNKIPKDTCLYRIKVTLLPMFTAVSLSLMRVVL
jgi:hypothetical protein